MPGCACRKHGGVRNPWTEEETARRFWLKVDKTEDCWLWTLWKNDKGYGKYAPYGGEIRLAHRYAYELTFDAIPDGLFVLHRCDTPACVRPDHLFLGTHRDNMDDMVAKGRQERDERHHSAVFTNDQVRQFREYSQRTGRGYRRLAREFGTPLGAMKDVLRGRSYRGVV